MDDLVRLNLLGAEDVTDLKSKAAATGSVDGVLGSAVDVGLAETRDAQKTIAGDLRSALFRRVENCPKDIDGKRKHLTARTTNGTYIYVQRIDT